MSRKLLKAGRLYNPDAVGLPYGDLMRDDESMERWRRTRLKQYELGKATRQLFKARKMTKKEFAEWAAHAGDIGDDEPLSKYI